MPIYIHKWNLNDATFTGNLEISDASGDLPKRIGKGFAPEDFGDIVGDWDASQLTGLNGGDTVSTWTDFSGQSRDLDNQRGTPTYETNEINGQPVVRFDGSSALYREDNPWETAAGIHVFVVWKTTTSNTGNDYIFSSPLNVGSNGWDLFMTGSNGVRSICRTDLAVGDTGTQGSGFNDGAARITEIRLDIAEASEEHKLFQDGATLDTNTVAGNDLGAQALEEISVAARTSTDVSWFTGDVARVIGYRTLTLDEATTIREKLASIYNITLS